MTASLDLGRRLSGGLYHAVPTQRAHRYTTRWNELFAVA